MVCLFCFDRGCALSCRCLYSVSVCHNRCNMLMRDFPLISSCHCFFGLSYVFGASTFILLFLKQTSSTHAILSFSIPLHCLCSSVLISDSRHKHPSKDRRMPNMPNSKRRREGNQQVWRRRSRSGNHRFPKLGLVSQATILIYPMWLLSDANCETAVLAFLVCGGILFELLNIVPAIWGWISGIFGFSK